MKKIAIILSVALTALACLCACSEKVQTSTQQQELTPATLAVSPSEISIEKLEGSTGTADITSDSEVLSASVDFPYRSWLGATVEGTVLKVKALTANTAAAVRVGEIIVYAGEGINTVSTRVKVTQALEDAVEPTLSCDRSEVTIASALNSFAIVNVTTNMDEFTASVADDGKDWLLASIEGAALTLKASSANEASSERSTTVELKAGMNGRFATLVISVKQSAKSLAIGDIVNGGVLFWISEDGKTGKVLAGPRGEGKAYCTDKTTATGDGGTQAATDRENGRVNVAVLKSVDASLDKFPAAQYCETMAPAGEWYLPAIEELTSIFKAYNGTTIDGATVDNPGKISAEEKAARALFDAAVLSLPGGVVLNAKDESTAGDSAFSSTEASLDKAYYVRFGKALCDKAVKNGTARTTRCIRTVNLN